MSQVGHRFVARRDREVVRRRRVSQVHLREDEPHPVSALAARSQLGGDRLPGHSRVVPVVTVLGQHEPREAVWVVVHCALLGRPHRARASRCRRIPREGRAAGYRRASISVMTSSTVSSSMSPRRRAITAISMGIRTVTRLAEWTFDHRFYLDLRRLGGHVADHGQFDAAVRVGPREPW